MFLLGKYGVQTTFSFPVQKRASQDLAATADWSPATGDTKISKDAGNVANTTNNPSAVGGTGSIMWKITLTATEMQAAVIDLQIVDAATKAIEDQTIKIYTFGNASGKIAADLGDIVRLGLTALPNTTPAGVGGLATVDASNAIAGIQSAGRNDIADSVLTRDWASIVVSVPARCALRALHFLRNKWTLSGGTMTVYEEDDTTVSFTSAVAQTAGNPISSSDPS